MWLRKDVKSCGFCRSQNESTRKNVTETLGETCVLTGLIICPTCLLVYKAFSIFLDDAYRDYTIFCLKIMLDSMI